MADLQSSSANAPPALPAAAQPAQPIISAYLTWQKTLVEYKTFAHIGEGTFGCAQLNNVCISGSIS
jgi:hypothetical protein